MKLLIKSLLVIGLMVWFSGCSAKTKLIENNINKDTIVKVDNLTVQVVAEDRYSIEEGHEDIIDDLRNDVIKELRDLGIASGGDLTVKILIEDYDGPNNLIILPTGGLSLLIAEVSFYDKNNNLLSELHVRSENNIGMYQDTFTQYAEDAFVKDLIKYMQEHYLIAKK